MSDTLIAPLADLPDLVRRETMAMESRLRRLLATPDIYRLRQIILTGSGDSLIAGVAVAGVLREWTGLPVQAMPAMEAARYVSAAAPAFHPRSMLVLCLSHSGESARVIEVAQRLRARGALTVALTGNGDSRLAQAAEIVGDVAVAPCANAAARGYVATLLGLWLLGLRIAEVRLRFSMDVAEARRADLVAQADVLEAALVPCGRACDAQGERWQGALCADALGSGPSLGSAQFAAAKLIETAGIHAAALDIEEFHHLNYFVANPAMVPAVLFGGAGSRAASRAEELAATLRQLGRPALLVTDRAAPQHDLPSLCLPRTAEWMTPLLHALPGVMLANAWAARTGIAPFRGHDGPWRGARDAALVRDSVIVTPPTAEVAEN